MDEKTADQVANVINSYNQSEERRAEISKILSKPFPDQLIKERPAPQGRGYLSYVEGSQYIKRLNQALGYNGWNFEIKLYQVLEFDIVVLGRLTDLSNGAFKEQFGGKRYKTIRKKDGKIVEMGEIGDCFKAAATDALKKCSSLMGLGLHLYMSDLDDIYGNDDLPDMSSNSGNSAPSESPPPSNNQSSGVPPITENQENAIKGMSKRLGIATDKIDPMMLEKYNKPLAELNIKEASTVITNLKKALGED